MISEKDLADLLLRHHGANAEDAALAAGLIIDEQDRTGRPLADLVEASKAGFPSFYRNTTLSEPPADAVPPSLPSSLTARVAAAARSGAPTPDKDILDAMNKMRGR